MLEKLFHIVQTMMLKNTLLNSFIMKPANLDITARVVKRSAVNIVAMPTTAIT